MKIESTQRLVLDQAEVKLAIASYALAKIQASIGAELSVKDLQDNLKFTDTPDRGREGIYLNTDICAEIKLTVTVDQP